MYIENHYDIGDMVYLHTDNDQLQRFVTGILVKPSSLTYALSCGSNESWHYDFEITVEKNVLKTSAN